MLLAVPELVLEKKGAIFLMEADTLVMKAQRNLEEPILAACARVPRGKCLCGMAAVSGQIVFCDDLDDRHETRYDGIAPHGHYCVPIHSGDTVAGVITLYTAPGRKLDERAELFLMTVADTLSVIIEGHRQEQKKTQLEGKLQQAQKMESVGRLAGGVAHDFNNMLMVIKGNAQLCQYKIEPGNPLHKWLSEIDRSTDRATMLTSQLLAFARRQPSEPKLLNLNATISDMLNLLHRLIGENIAINWQPGADLWPVELDPSQVDQILTNLLVNARDAINGAGSITISTANAIIDQYQCFLNPDAAPGDYVMLRVADTGCGMDQETRAHIFEPFYTTKAVGKGTGLGLATVFGIAKQNSGFIDVYSELGQGTHFKIYWPRAFGQEAPPVIEESSAAAVGGNETILLVEDEKPVRTIAHSFLASLGYTILDADCPETALRLVAEHPGKIHLVLTDVIMPGMNGKELAQRLLISRPDMKCIFMSGFTADVLAQRGILDSQLNFLAKPFSRDELARKMREVLTT